MTPEQRKNFEEIRDKYPHYEEDAKVIIACMKTAYNLALEDAANNCVPVWDRDRFVKESLKLKIE